MLAVAVMSYSVSLNTSTGFYFLENKLGHMGAEEAPPAEGAPQLVLVTAN